MQEGFSFLEAINTRPGAHAVTISNCASDGYALTVISF